MTPQEYASLDGVGLAELIRNRRLSSREAMEAATTVYERLNSELNAVVRLLPDRIAGAEEEGEPANGPFGGVPFLFKDNLAVRGLTVANGSALLADHVAESTHEIAKRMEATGVVGFGQSNMSEYGLLPYTEARLHGAVRNPWNLDYSAGGSSGGSAAAVAAGMVPLGHGNDGGGSIRIPASACGLFGLKPSRGRNPAQRPSYDGGIAVNHVLSRSVRDSAAMLDATCGPTKGEPWMPAPPKTPYSEVIREDPRPLRVAFATVDFAGNRAAPDCREAVERMARWCEELGHRVEERAPKIDGEAFNDAFTLLWAQGAGSVYRLAHQALLRRPTTPSAVRAVLRNRQLFRLALRLSRSHGMPVLEPFTRRLAAIDGRHTPSDLLLAQTTLKEVERRFHEFFSSYDLLLTPVLGEPPHRLGTFKHSWSAGKAQRFLNRYVGYTPIANTTGLPAASVPTLQTAEGLPVGTQFMAPLGREDLLFQIGAQIEAAHPWSGRKPLHSAWNM